jgi:hypothetical protein
MLAEQPKPVFFKDLARRFGVTERTLYNWFAAAGPLGWLDPTGDRQWFDEEDALWAADWLAFRTQVSSKAQLYIAAVQRNNYQRIFV